MCVEKRHVSEISGWPTSVREKPTVSHKCEGLWGNGTVHQSSFTECEKTPTLKKNITSNLKSMTEWSDAQEQNCAKQRTDAESSRTRLSAPCQTVCAATVTNLVATICKHL